MSFEINLVHKNEKHQIGQILFVKIIKKLKDILKIK